MAALAGGVQGPCPASRGCLVWAMFGAGIQPELSVDLFACIEKVAYCSIRGAGRDPQPAAQGPRGPKQGGLRSAAVSNRGTGLEGPLWATPSGLVMSPGDVRAEP